MNREQAIRQMAYALWEAEGRPHGRDGHHWTEAEAKIAQIAAAVDKTDGDDSTTVQAAKITKSAAPRKKAVAKSVEASIEVNKEVKKTSSNPTAKSRTSASAVKTSKTALPKL